MSLRKRKEARMGRVSREGRSQTGGWGVMEGWNQHGC